MSGPNGHAEKDHAPTSGPPPAMLASGVLQIPAERVKELVAALEVPFDQWTPPKLAVFDLNSGRLVATSGCPRCRRSLLRFRPQVFVHPGGEGYICVFQQENADHYRLLAKIPSALGARTAGYFGKGRKGFDRPYLAVPARADHGAEVWIYTIQD